MVAYLIFQIKQPVVFISRERMVWTLPYACTCNYTCSTLHIYQQSASMNDIQYIHVATIQCETTFGLRTFVNCTTE